MSAPIILFGPLPPPYGGVTVYLQTLNEHLRSENIRVWAYKGEPYKSDRIRFINQRRLETLWALISEGKNARILDATHFHLEYPNPLLLTIWLLLKPILRFQWYKNVHDGSLP